MEDRQQDNKRTFSNEQGRHSRRCQITMFRFELWFNIFFHSHVMSNYALLTLCENCPVVNCMMPNVAQS